MHLRLGHLVLAITGVLLVLCFALFGRDALRPGAGPRWKRRLVVAGLGLLAALGFSPVAVSKAEEPPAAGPARGGLERAPEWKRLQALAGEAEEIASGKRGSFPFDEKGKARLEQRFAAAPREVEALALADRISSRHGLPIACSIALPPCLVDTRPYRNLAFGFCAAGTERAYYTLDPLGNVRPCNHSPTILGNLRQTGFRRLAHGPAMRRFAEALPAFCAGCGRSAECRGCCKAAGEACSGSAGALEPFVAANQERARRPAPAGRWRIGPAN